MPFLILRFSLSHFDALLLLCYNRRMSTNNLWLDKPYFSLNAYLHQQFHEKVYKVSLDAGMTCPNRDGTLGERGCIFCSEGGSGDFSADRHFSITQQIDAQIRMIQAKRPITRFIAYFQAYTNTYAPLSYLQEIFTEAISHPQVVAISIGTRPDCLDDEVLCLLERLNRQKPVWVELGLQTIHASTAHYIRRGYDLPCFLDAVERLYRYRLTTIVHLILGLPGEQTSDVLASIDLMNTLPISGIKLQLLHVLKGTDLAVDYKNGLFHVMEKDAYIDLIIACIQHLRPDIVIHRLTGDGPRELLLAPDFSLNKRGLLNDIHHQMSLRGIRQGDLYQKKE